MKNKNFYITTTLPYVNGKAHIGHALEFIRADVLARHKRLAGYEVFFNTGTDEHGQKLFLNALELGVTPQEYVDAGAKNFKDLADRLGMSYDRFIRTTDDDHKKAAQEFWKICDQKGYIYKKNYQTKYCIGCELEKQDSELLEDGTCPDHPGKDLELIDEENYFFKWSAFAEDLLKYYSENHIIPEFRMNEIKTFVEGGIHDFSISRLKSKLEWGVPVPGDDEHVMYVWFDALVNYISTLGWGSDNSENFEKFWQGGTTFQICGKDNLRQQTAYWQALLFAAGIKGTDVIYINGHATADGQKMSKSIGNVIDPNDLIDEYGVDALRYFCVRHFHNNQDSDFTKERFHETYMANLVNGIGNLTNRILKMAEDNEVTTETKPNIDFEESLLEEYDFNGYGDSIWKEIGVLDQFITDEKPYKTIKSEDDSEKAKGIEDVRYLLEKLTEVVVKLQPIMPESCEKILKSISEVKKPEDPIFPRIEFEK